MKTLAVLGALLTALAVPLLSQTGSVTLKVRAVLVDSDLNQKPVPRLTLILTPADEASGQPITAKTSFEGTAELQLAPGNYRLATPDGIDFQGKKYLWEMNVTVSSAGASVDLSNDNAKVMGATPQAPARPVDNLTSLFKKYQNSVVTVWSEIGQGTGFVVDPAGLILTNQHVVGPSEYIAVQFDETRKVEARLVAFDAEQDIAVLWANCAPFPGVIAAPLAPKSDSASVAEGERVFTIGSPLNQQKILTAGIASKVEKHTILSDININPGNSGGPLFNSAGTVVGITTFNKSGGSGPGVSGIVRIEEAELLLARAKTKMRDMQEPSAALLPVEPEGVYPIDALKASLQRAKFDERPYIFSEGDYDVALITPVLKYHLTEGAPVEAEKAKERRTKKNAASVQETFRPLDDLKSWAEYIGEYRPILLVQASPKLRETLLSAWTRSVAASNGGYIAPAKMKFKTDFYRMKLFCGSQEIQPIQPGKVADVLNIHDPFVNITDATYQGIYSYSYDAISPMCGTVALELFSEKDPSKAVTKVIEPKTVAQIAADFAPFRNDRNDLSPRQDSPKQQ